VIGQETKNAGFRVLYVHDVWHFEEGFELNPSKYQNLQRQSAKASSRH
jgi:hypothetical protein